MVNRIEEMIVRKTEERYEMEDFTEDTKQPSLESRILQTERKSILAGKVDE